MTDLLPQQLDWYRETLPLAAMPGRGATVWVDIGANVGRVSEFFWRENPAAREIWSIEPLAENVAQIVERRERALAQVAEGDQARTAGPSWRIETLAMSNHNGTLRLRIERDAQGVANSSATAAPTQDHDVIEAACRSLSTLIPQAQVIKLDIEGHEYEVLNEALPQLSHARAWALELHMIPGRRLESVLAAFATRGYELLAATRKRGDASHRWYSVTIDPSLSWDKIPPAKVRPDGSAFKMLHVIARR